MPLITQITEQKRSPNRRNIFLDGVFAFGCNVNVVARFRLRDGMNLTSDEVEKIQLGEVKQECFDHAMRYIQTRLHGRVELQKKLMRREYGKVIVDAVLDDLQRLNYVNDEAYATARATSAAKHKHHGKRRAMAELLRKGVSRDVASRALDQVYSTSDSLAVARALAQKQLARLKRLDPHVARRRLVGMLQRRGFDYDTIKPVVDEVVGGIGTNDDLD